MDEATLNVDLAVSTLRANLSHIVRRWPGRVFDDKARQLLKTIVAGALAAALLEVALKPQLEDD